MRDVRKVLLAIHHGASLGGAPNSLFEILKRIDKTKYRILVVLPEEGPFSYLLKKEGIEYKVIPLFIFYYCAHSKDVLSIRNLPRFFIQALRNILHLSRILKKEDPHIVIINTSTCLLCGIIAKIMGRKVVWHIREIISTEKSWFLKKIISAIINFSAEKVIVMSDSSLRDMLNLKIKNITLVYNGVDLGKFRRKNITTEDFKRFGLESTDKIVGFVGQIYREKGWRVLVKAAFLVTQRLPQAKFLIVGSGDMMEGEYTQSLYQQWYTAEETQFHTTVQGLKLNDNFVFLGQRFDVENILPLMDCLVFPSIMSESFGRVMIEAMASGLPVVASNIGASSEIVIDNVTGLLFKPNNPKALSNALIEILTNEEKAKSMGEVGRKRAEEFFDIEKVVPQLLRIYRL